MKKIEKVKKMKGKPLQSEIQKKIHKLKRNNSPNKSSPLGLPSPQGLRGATGVPHRCPQYINHQDGGKDVLFPWSTSPPGCGAVVLFTKVCLAWVQLFSLNYESAGCEGPDSPWTFIGAHRLQSLQAEPCENLWGTTK